MPRPHWTALMPVGTVITEPDGTTYKKTHQSRREPFPWTTVEGSEYGDEQMVELIARGAQIKEPQL